MPALPDDPAADDLHYVFDNKVRFAETDAQGIVFYGEYVTYQDETFSAYLRELGYPYGEFEGVGIDFHVVHTEVDYHQPAAFDDELTSGTRVTSFGDSSVHFEWACRQRADDTVVATGEMSHVAVDSETGEPAKVPADFRASVREFQDRPPE
jgi:acyl-CoA thioester hydrolase